MVDPVIEADPNRQLGALYTAVDLVPVTPDDDNDLDDAARAIRCITAAGTLRITTQRGEVRNTSIALNEVLLVSAVRVHATGTTATGLEAMI